MTMAYKIDEKMGKRHALRMVQRAVDGLKTAPSAYT